MDNKTFVVLDCNDYANGFRIDKNGVDLSRFRLNPVMLYMHDRSLGVIGRWDNLRLEGERFVAEAVFDNTSETGRDVEHRVLGGFLRAASVGLDDVVTENGVVVSCTLTEISIVDIPASAHAVKMAKGGNGKGTLKLFALLKSPDGVDDTLRSKLIELLQLKPEASDDEIIEAVRASVNQGEIKAAEDNGLIDSNAAKLLYDAAGISPAFVKMSLSKAASDRSGRVREMIRQAEGKRVILSYERDIYERIGERVPEELFKALLGTLHTAPKVSEVLNLNNAKDLDYYRKYEPEALERDPALYQRLVKGNGGGAAVKDLDYYRKNNPEYLRENPEIYSKLVNNGM